MVAMCLQKDPSRRPTARALLEHRFFRHAKESAHIKKHLLEGLPPLPERFRLFWEGGAHNMRPPEHFRYGETRHRCAAAQSCER